MGGGRWEADGEFWFGNQGSAGCAAESKHIILVERDLLLTSAWEKPYRAKWQLTAHAKRRLQFQQRAHTPMVCFLYPDRRNHFRRDAARSSNEA